MEPIVLHRREWGYGQPVIAMHPLGLESSAFEGFGMVLARHGMRTIAVDLPGFGKTPMPEGRPTAAAMAVPVIELARSLPVPPVVLGISMGGRVALEAALTAPEAFRGVIPIAPYLPWLRHRFLMDRAWVIDPRIADWMPFEHLWPVLRWLARALETLPYLRDDEVAQAGARLVYYMSCPATRASFIAAARELALDQPWGEHGLWTRLPGIAVPAAFVWGEQDQLVSLRFSRAVARAVPHVPQLLLPCLGHWVNGPHHRCLAETVAGLVAGMLEGAVLEPDFEDASGVRFVTRHCIVGRTAVPAVPALGASGHGA
jgi:pimeloyl-ACP methyl ester carboxylesterase